MPSLTGCRNVNVIRIGLTMNVSWDLGSDRPRDCVSRDWATVLERAMPEALWVPIPNLGMGRVRDYVKSLELDGIILTGGGTLGEDNQRDQTELDLLELAISQRLPVFGAGRGFLLMQTRFGGNLVPVNGHRKTEHEVVLSDLPFLRHRFRRVPVNSEHTACIERLAPGLLPFAVDKRDCVEGAYHEAHRLLGVMWNPELPHAPSDLDAMVLKALFRYSE